MQYATPRHVASLDECWFYHVIDLPQHGTVNHFGSWDLRGRFDEYVGGVNLAGKTFLDVGTASGFLTFEAEKRGAIVTSFDVATGDDVNVDPKTSAAEKRKEVVMMQNGYWFAHRLLGSKARAVYGDAVRLCEYVDPVDIVLVAQLLVHVRDPLAVIQNACQTAKETVIMVEGSFETDDPIARFVGIDYPGTNTWWHLSTGLYRGALKTFGFEIESVSRERYRCNHPAAAGMQEICTFVARRAH